MAIVCMMETCIVSINIYIDKYDTGQNDLMIHVLMIRTLLRII